MTWGREEGGKKVPNASDTTLKERKNGAYEKREITPVKGEKFLRGVISKKRGGNRKNWGGKNFPWRPISPTKEESDPPAKGECQQNSKKGRQGGRD